MAGSAGSPRSSIIRPGDPGYDPRGNVSGVLNGAGTGSVFPTLPASNAMLPLAGSPQSQGGQQVTPNQSGMFATGAPAAQRAIGGPSNVMPNGMSSGDFSVAGNVMTLTPAIKSSG